MMRLWGRKSSINVQKVLWCLAELGLQEGKDFERIDAGLNFGLISGAEPKWLSTNLAGWGDCSLGIQYYPALSCTQVRYRQTLS
jgi:hypothetical protein